MTNEMKFWLDALKDARKQFYSAYGAYDTIFKALMDRKRMNVVKAIQGKTYHVEWGHVKPIHVEIAYDDHDIGKEPSAKLNIHFVRDMTEVEQLQGLTVRESALVKKFTEIYDKIKFTGYSLNNKKHIEDLFKIDNDIRYLKNEIRLYDRAYYWYSSDEIFNEDFIEKGLNYSNINIMPSGEYRPKNNE